MAWSNPILQAVFWSVLTVAFFVIGKRLHRFLGRWWSSPLVLTPLVLIALALSLHESYHAFVVQGAQIVAAEGELLVFGADAPVRLGLVAGGDVIDQLGLTDDGLAARFGRG